MDSVFHIFSQKNRSILRYFSAKSNGFRSNSDNSLAERRCLSGSLLCIINQNANGIGTIQHAIFIDIRTLFLCRIKLCFIACCNPCIFRQNSNCIGNINLFIAINITINICTSRELAAFNQQVCNCCMTGCGRVHICICNIDICPCMMQERTINICQINLSILCMGL